MESTHHRVLYTTGISFSKVKERLISGLEVLLREGITSPAGPFEYKGLMDDPWCCPKKAALHGPAET